LKSLVHRILRSLGYDIRRFDPAVFPEAQCTALMRHHGVNLVLDVGANAGQYARGLRESGYRGRIVCYEPLEAARRQLEAARAGDSLWEIGERVAVGEREGEVEINVSGNSASSSLLDMLPSHLRSAPDSRYVGVERVPMRRLDALAEHYFSPGVVALLKIDTQGYEDRVLDGAAGVLPDLTAIQLELSLIPLYSGQKLLPEMMDRICGLGFRLCAIWPAFLEPGSGRLLQVDATFYRDAP
jgi:FkbM family methyltransferase